jgi:hypothetical protein
MADLDNPSFWGVVAVFSVLVIALVWMFPSFSRLSMKIAFSVAAPLLIFAVAYKMLD